MLKKNPTKSFHTTDDAHIDIQIKTERKWSDFYFYKSQLTLHNVSLDTNYTSFGCGFSPDWNQQFKVISFTIEGIT